MLESLIPDILFGFTGLISIINPFGVAFVFLDRTASLSADERTALAKKIAINVLCVLLVGTKVAMRVSSFLLLCIGVQIMLTGFSEFLIPIAQMQPAGR